MARGDWLVFVTLCACAPGGDTGGDDTNDDDTADTGTPIPTDFTVRTEPFDTTLLVFRVLATGEVLGAPAPVSPATNNVGLVWPSIDTPDTYSALASLEGHIGVSGVGLSRVGDDLVTVGSSVVSDPRDGGGDPRLDVPVRWDAPNAAPTPLAMGSASTGVATDIDATGRIVGRLDDALVLWTSPESFTEIATGATNRTFDIADTGQIATRQRSDGSIWTSADAEPIPLGLEGQYGRALAMNATGLLVGADHEPSDTYGQSEHAVVWAPEEGYALRRLQAPEGATTFSATVVGDNGWIAGPVTYADGSRSVVVWYSATEMADLSEHVDDTIELFGPRGILADGTIVCGGRASGTPSLVYLEP